MACASFVCRLGGRANPGILRRPCTGAGFRVLGQHQSGLKSVPSCVGKPQGACLRFSHLLSPTTCVTISHSLYRPPKVIMAQEVSPIFQRTGLFQHPKQHCPAPGLTCHNRALHLLLGQFRELLSIILALPGFLHRIHLVLRY